jgi:hypothetical protein
MRSLIAFLGIILTTLGLNAQEIVGKIENQGDTLIVASIKPITILSRNFSSGKEKSDFNKLKRNTAKVYPYAKMAGEIYAQMQEDMNNLDKKRQKKKYKKVQEKELRAKFEEEIKDLNTTQGAILVKLINRETGNNCYKLIKELKNPISAFFYQALAKKWGYDLKEVYKAEENADLEFIVGALERGDIIK